MHHASPVAHFQSWGQQLQSRKIWKLISLEILLYTAAYYDARNLIVPLSFIIDSNDRKGPAYTSNNQRPVRHLPVCDAKFHFATRIGNPDRRNASAMQQQTDPKSANPNESDTRKARYPITSSERDRYHWQEIIHAPLQFELKRPPPHYLKHFRFHLRRALIISETEARGVSDASAVCKGEDVIDGRVSWANERSLE